MASVSYDPEAKALYVHIEDDQNERQKNQKKKKIVTTVPISNNWYLDVDETGKAVGFEVIFPQNVPQEAIDAIIKNPEEIALLIAKNK
ncbi:MAG TPA: DUF2283 domain-containing protein [Nitrososphaeraceae archaeon]|nr:DUF2283 domain-containing protein [Nitrososphaeraceae archaeon]